MKFNILLTTYEILLKDKVRIYVQLQSWPMGFLVRVTLLVQSGVTCT